MANSPAEGDRSSRLYQRILSMLGGQFVRAVVQGVYFVALARALGPSDFGSFSAVVALAAIATPVSSLGSNFLMIRSASRDATDRVDQWLRAAALTVLGGLALALVLAVLGSFLVAGGEVSFLALLLLLITDLIGQKMVETAALYWQSVGNSRPILFWPTLTNVLRLAAALVLTFTPSSSLDFWSILYAVATLPFALVVFAYTSTRTGLRRVSLRLSAADLRTGMSFAIGSTSQTVYSDIDKVMLAGLSSPYASGLYSAAYRIVDMAYLPIRAIAATTYPLFFREGRHGIRGPLRLVRKVAPLAFGYAIPSAVALTFAAPLVPIVLGTEYDGAEAILPWLSLLLVTRTASFLAVDSLSGADLVGSRTLVQVAIAIVNIGLNFILLPTYGIAGAVLSTFICEIALVTSLWLLVARAWKAAGPDGVR
jgi:O-antigen/teichoic acid export membrane protein